MTLLKYKHMYNYSMNFRDSSYEFWTSISNHVTLFYNPGYLESFFDMGCKIKTIKINTDVKNCDLILLNCEDFPEERPVFDTCNMDYYHPMFSDELEQLRFCYE